MNRYTEDEDGRNLDAQADYYQAIADSQCGGRVLQKAKQRITELEAALREIVELRIAKIERELIENWPTGENVAIEKIYLKGIKYGYEVTAAIAAKALKGEQ